VKNGFGELSVDSSGIFPFGRWPYQLHDIEFYRAHSKFYGFRAHHTGMTKEKQAF
jgi:hypothetical protein